MKDHVGFGALIAAFGELSEGGYRKVLVVASESGWRRFNEHETRPFFAERETRFFSAFTPNPEIGEIMAGVQVLREFGPDLIVAYGGGSPIDVAKMMKAISFTRGEFDPGEPQRLAVSGDGPPLVAVTTTAGSGSEATPYAVFYRGVEKQSVGDAGLRPEMAVADPELTYSLPPYQTASTGFDAICQGVEAYWASSTTEEAREYGAAAIGYGLGHIEGAVRSPAPGSRYYMVMASYVSGKAIEITRTTMPHALAYHLTKVYGVSHGHACALTLPYFFEINMDKGLEVNSCLGVEGHRRNMGDLFRLLGVGSGEEAWGFWRGLMERCGLEWRLGGVGVDSEEKVRGLVGSMDLVRQANQPVKVESEYLVEKFMDRLW